MIGLVLGLLLIVAASDPMDAARNATLAGDYEKSAAILDGFQPTAKNYNDYHYYSLVNHFKLNHKDAAVKHYTALENSFSKLNRRQDSLVFLMGEDLKHWKDGDLKDISRDMGNSADRLQIAKAGNNTQKVQKDIVDKLDKLIKDAEDKANGAGAGAGAQADGKDQQGKQQQGPGGMGQPAPDSIVMGGAGKGQVDDRKLRQIAENWGTLPPDRRAAIVQEITRDLPAKYKPMIDEYFRALNRTHYPKP